MTYVMANDDKLFEILEEHIFTHSHDLPINISEAHTYISSPRLFDIFAHKDLQLMKTKVADSFLDERTMLADNYQQTYAISLAVWNDLKSNIIEVQNFYRRDRSIIRLQIWPFDPATLNEEVMRLAVALSFTTQELKREERVAGAVDEIIRPLGFKIDDEILHL